MTTYLKNGKWRCNLCGCGGFLCSCIAPNEVKYICQECEFPSASPDTLCRYCQSLDLLHSKTLKPINAPQPINVPKLDMEAIGKQVDDLANAYLSGVVAHNLSCNLTTSAKHLTSAYKFAADNLELKMSLRAAMLKQLEEGLDAK